MKRLEMLVKLAKSVAGLDILYVTDYPNFDSRNVTLYCKNDALYTLFTAFPKLNFNGKSTIYFIKTTDSYKARGMRFDVVSMSPIISKTQKSSLFHFYLKHTLKNNNLAMIGGWDDIDWEDDYMDDTFDELKKFFEDPKYDKYDLKKKNPDLYCSCEKPKKVKSSTTVGTAKRDDFWFCKNCKKEYVD